MTLKERLLIILPLVVILVGVVFFVVSRPRPGELVESGEAACCDAVDNDGDGLVDCDDNGCLGSDVCK